MIIVHERGAQGPLQSVEAKFLSFFIQPIIMSVKKVSFE